MKNVQFSSMMTTDNNELLLFDFKVLVSLKEIEKFISKDLYNRLIEIEEDFYLLYEPDLVIRDGNNQLTIYQKQFGENESDLISLTTKDLALQVLEDDMASIPYLGCFFSEDNNCLFGLHDNYHIYSSRNFKESSQFISLIDDDNLFYDHYYDLGRVLHVTNYHLSELAQEIVYLGIRNLSP